MFQPNFRGSDGYGSAYVDAGHGEWGRKMQTDVSDGLAALAAQGLIDPKRACIVGGSYGGYAALAGVTLQHGLYRCAVADAPVTDLRAYLRYEDARGWASDNGRPGIGGRSWARSRMLDLELDEISPAKFADHADALIPLIHGMDDTVVPVPSRASKCKAFPTMRASSSRWW